MVETFHSLQGEGLHSGRSAFFIRLGGCDVGCRWCDTKHSWRVDGHPRQSPGALTHQAGQASGQGACFVVITGGEPLQHDLDPLTEALARLGLPLHLETSGVHPLSGRFDWITLSPKPHRPPRQELLARCDELKVIVHGENDLVFAEAMADAAQGLQEQGVREQAGPALLLQPGWDCAEGQELALAHVQRHPAWRLSLQSHKWLGVR